MEAGDSRAKPSEASEIAGCDENWRPTERVPIGRGGCAETSSGMLRRAGRNPTEVEEGPAAAEAMAAAAAEGPDPAATAPDETATTEVMKQSRFHTMYYL
jgi:hypothetical protein